MSKNILILPGDGIGQEIVTEAVKVLDCLKKDFGLKIETEQALVGGAAYDDCGTPLPESTLNLCKASDSILLGAVGADPLAPQPHGASGSCARENSTGANN